MDTLFSYEGNKTMVTVNKNGNFQYRMIIDNDPSGVAKNVLCQTNEPVSDAPLIK